MELLICFVFIIVLIRIKVPVGVTLAATAILLSFLEFGIAKSGFEPLRATLADWETWKFIATVILIVTFGEVLAREGYNRRLVHVLKAFLSPKAIARVAPAMIGLLPMPGGAMVSAPVVLELARDTNISPAAKTVANYWWRHIWEPIWPLYQSVILAAAILHITVWRVSWIALPISITCIVAGIIFSGLPLTKTRTSSISFFKFLTGLLNCLWPILIIVITGIGLKLDLIFGILLILLILLVMRITSLKTLWQSLRREFSWDIIILFVGSLALMRVIVSGDAATDLTRLLGEWRFPVQAVVFVIPFLIGLLTGLTSAYVGVGFPIVMTLFPACGGLAEGALMAYAGGLMGILASPVHLCLVLTKNYFGAGFGGVYRKLIPAILFCTTILFLFKLIFYRG